jgi:hypothetical protein
LGVPWKLELGSWEFLRSSLGVGSWEFLGGWELDVGSWKL